MQEQKDLAAKLGGSYGEGDVFVSLVDRCFEAKARGCSGAGRAVWMLAQWARAPCAAAFPPSTAACGRIPSQHCRLPPLPPPLPAAVFFGLFIDFNQFLTTKPPSRHSPAHPQVDKYTYEVCPYGRAAQKEGHSSTNLGAWAGLEDNGTRMDFR